MRCLRQFRALFLGLIGALALLVVPVAQPAHASASDGYEKSVYVNTNLQRTSHGRVPLRGSKCLDRFAERQARAMARKRQMYHQKLGPILTTCHLGTVGENVAYGFPGGKSVVGAWMDSPGHRANILRSRYRLIAVGAYRDSRGTWYVSQVFGGR
jgi:uncharacterized protein YkwD